jgi:cytochrome c5
MSQVQKILMTGVAGIVLALSGVAQAEDAGKATYDSKCAVCHANGVAGAPKFGDKEAWAPRIATGEDAMMSSVINGKNAMPPKGACMDCSEADLKAAMQYMVSHAQ